MRTAVVAALFSAALAAGAAAGYARDARFIAFRTPSGNIGCIYTNAPDVLRCDIRSGLNPRPRSPGRCDGEYGDALQMGPAGRPAIICHGDTAIEPGSQKLAYGRSLGLGPFQCTSRTTGLTCTNSRGHGWFLSRESYRLF